MRSTPQRVWNLYRDRGLAVTLGAGLLHIAKKTSTTSEAIEQQAWIYYQSASFSYETGKPLSTCLRIASTGFPAESYYFLGLDAKDEQFYFRTRKPIQEINQNAEHVLYDKLAIYNIFDGIGEYFPALIATIHDGRYEPQHSSTSSLLDAVNTHGTIAAKPIDRWEGEGFLKISAENGYSINGEPVSAENIVDLQNSFEYPNYMVTEFVEQHSYASQIFSESTNTIRLLTATDPETGETTVVTAAHRFGTNQSAPVDNWSNGGVVAPIDVSAGKMMKLVLLDEDGFRRRRTDHPDTEARVAGVDIPLWETIKTLAENGAQSYPNAKLIGWDFVVGAEQPYILEASAAPGVNTLQLERGLLEHPTVQKIFSASEGVNSRITA